MYEDVVAEVSVPEWVESMGGVNDLLEVHIVACASTWSWYKAFVVVQYICCKHVVQYDCNGMLCFGQCA